MVIEGVGATEPQPGFLNGVIGIAARAEHPECHRFQAGPVLFEALCQPVLVGHCYLPCPSSVMGCDEIVRADVTRSRGGVTVEPRRKNRAAD